jgi:hypothetical protein
LVSGDRAGRSWPGRSNCRRYSPAQVAQIAPPAPHEPNDYHHLTLPKDYSLLSNADIDHEYQHLRRLLVSVNEQAARNVAKIAAKPLRQSRILESSKVMEVRER